MNKEIERMIIELEKECKAQNVELLYVLQILKQAKEVLRFVVQLSV